MRELQESFKVVMDRIEQWASKDKLRFSVPKTKAIVLKGPITRRRYPTLKLYNRTIGFVEELKYLGVIINRKLTFLPHAKSLATKSKTNFHNITKVARLNYRTKAQVMAKIYKAVYEPIMSYAAPVWAHRTQNTHVQRSLRSGQRKVLLSLTGAYRTTSFMALTIVTGAMPIDLKILEMSERVRLKEGLREGNVGGVREEAMERWQTEWEEAEAGRYTYEILPSVEERQKLKYIHYNHLGVQLVTGHGAFGTYLYKHNKLETSNCEHCPDQLDSPNHVMIHCTRFEDVREPIRQAVEDLQMRWPPTLALLLNNKRTFEETLKMWAQAKHIRNI